MEQVPNWLTDTVTAAGMTCFAEGLDPIYARKTAKAPVDEIQLDEAQPPVH